MGARIRAARQTLASAPWRRAPLLLRHRPGVLATIAGACAVMVATAAAVPLFLSSVGTESVALQVAERCPRDTGAQLTFAATAAEVRTPPADPFRPLADRLEPANVWVRLEGLNLAGAGPTADTPASLLARDGALDHVDVIAGEPGPGLWISDRASSLTGLGVGDEATIGAARLPVAGLYRDLAGTAVDDFWCSNTELLLVDAELIPPPPLLLVDPSTFADLMGSLGVDRAWGSWDATLRQGLTVTDTNALVGDLACSTERASGLRWCEGGRPRLPGPRRFGVVGEGQEARDDAEFVERYLHSHLPFLNDRSQAIQTAVGGGVWPMALFGTLAGVGLVAAAASLWFDRRRREVTLLTVRGVSPAALGLKAVLEMSIALVVGAAVGVGAAYGMVVWLGPSPVLERAALGRAAVGGVVALAGAALTVGVVVGHRSRTHEARRHREGVRLVPWELALGALTVVSYRRLGDWGIPVGRGAEVSAVDVWGLLFPLLFLLTGVALLRRVLLLALRPLRAASRSWPTPLYLGVRRVARYRVAVVGLVAASAIAAGVLGYAATMNRSLDATLHAKATTFVGSDVAVRVTADAPLPAALADRATVVDIYWRAAITGARRVAVVVVAIDPATFEHAAFWDDTFSDQSLTSILDRLAVAPVDGPTPAVVMGAGVDGTATLVIDDPGATNLTIEPIAGVRAFPGTKRGKPTVFVAASALDGRDLLTRRTEAWISGDRDEVRAALDPAGTGFVEARRLSDVADTSSFLTVSWTFGFMLSLGISAGLLVLGGVAVYLDARRRDRLLGYAFMQRMGLTAAQHRRALAVELAASVLVGCWFGLGSSLAAAWLAYPRVDPVPTFLPDPLLRPALPLILGLAGLSVVVVGVAALLGQRGMDRDDPVEVLRAGA